MKLKININIYIMLNFLLLNLEIRFKLHCQYHLVNQITYHKINTPNIFYN